MGNEYDDDKVTIHSLATSSPTTSSTPTSAPAEAASEVQAGAPLDPLGAANAALRESWEAENRASGLRLVAAHTVMAQCVIDPVCADAADEPRPGYGVVDPELMAATHLVRMLSISSTRARLMISFAADLHFRYPALLESMLAGLMEQKVARALALQMSNVDESVLDEVQKRVVEDYLDRLAAGERPNINDAKAHADRIIIDMDRDAVRLRKDDAARARGVRINKGQDGMTTVNATLRSDEAAVLAEALDEQVELDREAENAARDTARAEAESSGEPEPDSTDDEGYTEAQRRADALMSKVCGGLGPAHGGEPEPGPGGDTDGSPSGGSGGNGGGAGGNTTGGGLSLRPRITVITNPTGGNVPDGSHLSEAGVEFPRSGEAAIESLLAMLKLADNTVIESVDPTIGAADSDEESLRYRPGAALARRIRLRDGTCRHPGCAVPAEACDLDHVVPFNHDDPAAGGLTVEWNLAAQCRSHHRFKTFAGWDYRMEPDGTLVLTSPDGETMYTRPTGPLARYRLARERAEAGAWDGYRDYDPAPHDTSGKGLPGELRADAVTERHRRVARAARRARRQSHGAATWAQPFTTCVAHHGTAESTTHGTTEYQRQYDELNAKRRPHSAQQGDEPPV
ncbi:hypothetical protein NCCP2495_29370 [Dietzia sp. NCCP-2495]|uniref:HNH endonuclease signature motif containing protein n=1 Tax=Dietzia sp. NCCP-2495 TaxID=2934675 RepID=UPI002230DB93|nr:HNH endonuclease signature motif containing protein [Dietzia sp. NCCP-2495]GLB65057.1 hypothetical protein NCCP2495_29370 [Dietzia sp. NCCP-2495]